MIAPNVIDRYLMGNNFQLGSICGPGGSVTVNSFSFRNFSPDSITNGYIWKECVRWMTTSPEKPNKQISSKLGMSAVSRLSCPLLHKSGYLWKASFSEQAVFSNIPEARNSRSVLLKLKGKKCGRGRERSKRWVERTRLRRTKAELQGFLWKPWPTPATIQARTVNLIFKG